MPNRIIKESIWTSPNLNRLSAEAERHFYRCIVDADDHGCFEATPPIVRGKLYPLKSDFEVSNDSIRLWFKELVDAGLVLLWTGDDEREYCIFRNWSKHNTPRSLHRRKTPPPPDDVMNMVSKSKRKFSIENNEAWEHMEEVTPEDIEDLLEQAIEKREREGPATYVPEIPPPPEENEF